MECANEQLVVAIVTDRPTHRAHTRTQRRLGDDSTLPHRIYQFFPADDPIAIANQMNKQIEDLRFDRNDLACTAQLVTRDINFIVRETECRAIHLRGGLIQIRVLQSIALARPLTYDVTYSSSSEDIHVLFSAQKSPLTVRALTERKADNISFQE